MAIEVNDSNAAKCKCGSCPSFPAGGDKGLYCGMGKSSQEITQNGCMCPTCEVFTENNLSDGYFCVNGAA